MENLKYIKESLNEENVTIPHLNENIEEDSLTIRSLPSEVCANGICMQSNPETTDTETIVIVNNETSEEDEDKYSKHVKMIKGTLDNELAKPEDARYFIRFKIKEKGKSDKTLPIYKGIPVSKATETDYVFKTGKREIKVFSLEDMILEGCGGNPNFHINKKDETLDEDEELRKKSAEQRKRQQDLLNKSKELKQKSSTLASKTKSHLEEEMDEEDDTELNEISDDLHRKSVKAAHELGKNKQADRLLKNRISKYFNKPFQLDKSISAIKDTRLIKEDKFSKLILSVFCGGHKIDIKYNIDEDNYENVFDIDLKGAKILGAIAKTINNNTKYKLPTRNFNVDEIH